MRIALDARKVRDGGIGTYIRELLLALAAAPGPHEYVALLDPRDLGAFAWTSDHVREVPVRAAKYGLAEHLAVPRAARAAGATLLHEPHYTLPLGWRGPAVVTIHDLIHLSHARFFRPGAALYARAVAGAAVRRARLVVADSGFTRDEIVARLGADPARVRVVPLGVPAGLARRDEAEVAAFRRQRALPADYLLYVGARKAHKNLPLLLEALARLAPGLASPARALGPAVGRRRPAGAPRRPPRRRPVPALRRHARRRQRARLPLLGRRALRAARARRGLRPAAARGHGLRHARAVLDRRRAARDRGRGRRAAAAVRPRAPGRRRSPRCSATPAGARRWRSAASRGRGSSPGRARRRRRGRSTPRRGRGHDLPHRPARLGPHLGPPARRRGRAPGPPDALQRHRRGQARLPRPRPAAQRTRGRGRLRQRAAARPRRPGRRARTRGHGRLAQRPAPGRRTAEATGTSLHRVRADALALPLADASCDLVLSGGLLEHFADPRPVLAEMVRILRPGGTFYADVVPRKVSFYRVREAPRILRSPWLLPGVYESPLGPGPYRRLLGELGCEAIRTRGAGFYPPVAAPAIARLDARPRRHVPRRLAGLVLHDRGPPRVGAARGAVSARSSRGRRAAPSGTGCARRSPSDQLRM